MKQEYIDQMYGEPAVQEVQTVESQPQAEQAQTVESQPSAQTDEFGYQQKQESVGNPYSLESGSVEDSLYGDSQKVELSSDTDLGVIYQ